MTINPLTGAEMPDVPLCKARSQQLNCGCCNNVFLDCELEEGHPGEWHYTGEPDGSFIQVAVWWKAEGKPEPSVMPELAYMALAYAVWKAQQRTQSTVDESQKD